MDKKEFDNFKFDHILDIMADEALFGQWLGKFFYLNNALQKEYDTIYQNSFYITFYKLIYVGIGYTKSILTHLEGSENLKNIEFYKEIFQSLTNLKSEFSESEFEFIEYKRHSASHIFQTGYQKKLLNNGTIKNTKNQKLLDVLDREFAQILIKHGFDRGFDKYMTDKLYPKILELEQELKKSQK
ncbi:MAG: hypothetical protein JJE55_07385 [Flavobacteriaceae bacterium]|nr:hypothetical protein [Flavobacteriaceae bacterium]